MLIIRSSTDMALALQSPISPDLKILLARRRDQLKENFDPDLGELAQFIVVEPGDMFAAIEAAANYPLLPDPPWEWVLDHDGILEAPIIFSDDGFGVVLIVPDHEEVDPLLLDLLRRDAVPANGEGAAA